MQNITVFCGSSFGTDKIFADQATALGRALAKQNTGIIYGGANVGLMGCVADGALQNGGKVIGVLPVFLQRKELAHQQLTELILVETMHERKTKMHDLCDGFIALPGGFGTFEELFEILTWGQLGLHTKPVGLLNTNGFYNDLISMLQTMVIKGFLKQSNCDMLLVSDDIDALLKMMQQYKAPLVEKWISNATT
jgi:uncharacterized protein (TIGR00730 family)